MEDVGRRPQSAADEPLPSPAPNFKRTGNTAKSLASPFPGGKPPPSGRPLTCSQGQASSSSGAAPDGAGSSLHQDEGERPSSPPRAPAFNANGPVEAVALHSDWQFWNVFSDQRTIGKGHFAKVKHVMHLDSHEDFAAKILDKSLADNDIEDLVRAAPAPATCSEELGARTRCCSSHPPLSRFSSSVAFRRPSPLPPFAPPRFLPHQPAALSCVAPSSAAVRPPSTSGARVPDAARASPSKHHSFVCGV